MNKALLLLALFWSFSAYGETIEFPEEELATESVLPVFDQPDAVKARSVLTSKRLEVGGFLGWSLTEALVEPLNFGGSLSYHFNEDHAFNLHANFWVGGESSYSKQLNSPAVSDPPLNLQYAPVPKWMVLGSYQYTAFYGKMSIAKQYIMNLSLYGLAGVGAIAIGDSTNPVASLGIGQKFHFTSNLALRVDLRMLAYRGPNPISRNLSTVTEVQPASSFDQELMFGSLLSVGAIYLIPNS